MGRRPREIEVIEVTFAEPKGFEARNGWAEATEVLLRVQQRLADQGKMVAGGNRPSGGTGVGVFRMDAAPLLADFRQVAALSGLPIAEDDVAHEALPAPHRRPKRLPPGKKGVYVFATANRCLKVGKVGPKSAARFTAQHYAPRSSQSNLARSLLSLAAGASVARAGGSEDVDAAFAALTADTVGPWIEENTSRFHFFLRADAPDLLLTLLEAFLQCRLRPLFEGG